MNPPSSQFPSTGSIFVSHASLPEDQQLAIGLIEALSGRGFRNVFFSSQPKRGITIGDPWEQALYDQLKHAGVVLFFLTPASLNSNWCFAELALARAFGKPILTLRQSKKQLVHPLTAQLQIENIEDDGAVDRICTWLLRHISPRETAWQRDICPFPGLEAYSREMESVFFGREEIVSELLEVFAPFRQTDRARRVVVVSGPSGSGKSSLVHAGLAGPLSRRPGWTVLIPLVPGKDPLQRLAAAIFETRPTSTPENDAGSIYEELRSGSIKAFESFFIQDAPDRTYRSQVVIIVDQFEELATVTEARMASAFLNILNTLVTGSLPVWLLLTIRSEFLSHPERSNAITQFLDAQHLNYLLMTPATSRPLLERIIRNPASVADVSVEPAFIDSLVNDMTKTSTTGTPLPLLAFALRLSWEHMENRLHGVPGRRTLILDDYVATGGLRKVITERAHHAMRRLALMGCQDLIFPTIGRFVVPLNTGDRPVRRRLPITALKDDALKVAREFEEQRLIRVVIENEGAAFDIVHEAVFEAWTDFRDWLIQHWETLKDVSEIERRAHTWESQGHMAEDLLRGALLQRVVGLPQVVEDPLLNQFVALSVEADKEYRDAALERQTEHMVSEALLHLTHSPMRSLRQVFDATMACERANVTPPHHVQEALFQVLTTAREMGCWQMHNASVRRIATGPDGCLVSGGDDRTILVMENIHGGKARTLAKLNAGITALCFADHSMMLVSADDAGKIILWNLEDNLRLREVSVSPDVVISLACDPESGLVACLAESGRLSVRRLPGLELLMEKTAHTGYGSTSVFDGANRRILTSGADGRLIAWYLPELEIGMQIQAHSGPVCALALGPGGSPIATGGLDGYVKLWDHNLQMLSRPIEAHTGYVSALHFSPDGRSVYSGGFDGIIRQWRLDGAEANHPLVGHAGTVCSLALNPKQNVLISAGDDCTLREWKPRGRLLAESEFVFSEPINVVACLSENMILASGDNRIVMLSATNGQTETVWEAHQDYVWGLAVSPDSNTLASSSADGAVRLWDLKGRALSEKPFMDHEDDVIDVTFTSQGDRILSGGADGAIRLWSRDGRLLNRAIGYHDGQVNAVRCLYPGSGIQVLSGGSDGFLRLWTIEGEPITSREAHTGGVRNLAVSIDGTRLFSVGEDGFLRAWSSDLEESLGIVQAHNGMARRIVGDAAGGAVTVGADGILKRWTAGLVSFGTPIHAHVGGAWALDLTPGGGKIATGGDDGVIRVWRLANWETDVEECKLQLQQYLSSSNGTA